MAEEYELEELSDGERLFVGVLGGGFAGSAVADSALIGAAAGYLWATRG